MDPQTDQTSASSVQGLPPGVTLRPIQTPPTSAPPAPTQQSASGPNLPPGVTLRPVQSQATSQATPPPNSTETVPPKTAPDQSEDSGFLSGIVRGAKNIGAMPGQLWDAVTKGPQTQEEQAVHELGLSGPQGYIPGPLALPIHRLVIAPAEAAQARGEKYEQMAATEKDPKLKKQLLDAAGTYKSVGTYLPLIGPLASQLAERAAYGPQGASKLDAQGGGGWENANQDLTGALGESTAYIAAPKVLEKAGGGIVKSLVKPSTTVDIAGTPVPVRGTVAEPPSFPAKVGESLASAPKLQEFDVTKTQPAARAAIGNIATEEVAKPGMHELKMAQLAGTDVGLENEGKIDDYWKKAVADSSGDFGKVYRGLKSELQKFYQKADQVGVQEGEGQNAFSDAQKEAQAARVRGDVKAETEALNKQQELFEKANGEGTFRTVKKLYSKLDAVEEIGKEFDKKSVIKRTPQQFLQPEEPGKPYFDRGIIDGAALRDAVRTLNKPSPGETVSTFEKAGVSPETVGQLQKLGELLERSKVQPGTKPSGILGTIVKFTGRTTVGNALAYLMTNPNTLNAVVNTYQGALRTPGVGVASGAVGAAPTHIYNPITGKVEESQ